MWIKLQPRERSEITDLHAGKTSRWDRISAVEARRVYLNSKFELRPFYRCEYTSHTRLWVPSGRVSGLTDKKIRVVGQDHRDVADTKYIMALLHKKGAARCG